ncbi:MAG: hypothetical protein GX069_03910 [Tissierellia bacterium]|nr:hypothetical protein [Tissierellia bacterium]
MFTNDIIDKKIEALLNFVGQTIDEEESDDILFYSELRKFAEENGGLLYNIYDESYLILNFIGEDEFHIIEIIKE